MKNKYLYRIIADFLKIINIRKSWNCLLIASMLSTCSSSGDLTEGKLVILQELPAVLSENSGMAEFNGLLWFINDGGNEPLLHGYNATTGRIERQVGIINVENIDWEEITQDESHVYIGDFGNNSGNRKDLRIIILDKQDILESESVSPSGIIHFSYADQDDFTPAAQHNSYDCEAFLVFEDSILLFTKDWIREETSIYSLPSKAGEYQASMRKRFDNSGLITGSAYLESEKQLVLLGYVNYVPFIWIIHDFDILNMHVDNAVRIDFNSSLAVQTEALVISDNRSIKIASEQAVFPARLYRAEF
jgi:hypothetical protein